MKKILISGSIAYDYIMNFDNDFQNAINTDSSGVTNASLLINKLKKEAGGTGLNIAFNLAMLGENAILLGAVGDDFIFDGFIKEKIDLNYIHISEKLLSASAYIINDNLGGQITSFYPGALDEAEEISISKVVEKINYLIVSPNNKAAMLKHLKEGKKHGIKTFFDPGQMLGTFSKEELGTGIKYADFLIVNESEFNMYQKISEKDEIELLDDFEKIIVTLGSKGSKIIDRSGVLYINPVEVENALDPTGAGDAYRAGLLKGLKLGFDLETSAKIGSVVSSYCVQFHGAQNHIVTKKIVKEDMKKHFKINIEL